MKYLTVPFEKGYSREEFCCNKQSLDSYLQKQVSQDIRKRHSVCFVLLAEDHNSILGYYTLSNGSIPYSDVPEHLKKKYPRSYDYIPVTLLGRFALDNSIQGKGFGAKLLIDDLKRSLIVAGSIESVAVIADPLDKAAENFYEHFGFVMIPNSGKMFLDMNTIRLL